MGCRNSIYYLYHVESRRKIPMARRDRLRYIEDILRRCGAVYRTCGVVDVEVGLWRSD